ncbi:MAG TPA: hypothetical protein VFF20_06705 [Pseudogracilibacillus sp.]|nr:hypothetical protein [Pseudogracilibacillus sp.]
MQKDIKGVLYFLSVNVRYPLGVFWTILFSIYLISILFSVISSNENVLFQASIPIYIFCLVLGMWTVKNTIPYLLNMSVTRKLIFISVGIYFLLLAIFQAVLANILTVIISLLGMKAMSGEISLIDGDKEFTFYFTHLSQFLENDSLMNQIMIDSIICFVALSSMFFVGLIFYRFGLVGGFSFLGALFIVYILSIARGSFIDLMTYFIDNYSMALYFQLFGLGFLLYLLSFIVLRRVTTISS